MTRKKVIRNGTIATLSAVVVAIIIQQNRDPDSPLSRTERETISEVRRRAKLAKGWSDEAQVKAMLSILKLLEQRGYSTVKITVYLHRLLRQKLEGMDSVMAEALLDELSALAQQKDV